jgi:predicted TIM-barrel fold metal-dependent hydrolase
MAAVFCSAVNDLVVDRWLDADARFRFAIAVAPHDAGRAVAEIERLGRDRRAVAVCLPLVAQSMGHVHYHPIYAAAERLRLPVMVHPSGFEGAVVGPARLGGVGPYTPEETFSLLPQVAMSNLASLVFDGVFERFPELKVIFAGFGCAWAPPVLWRADAEWRGLRVEVPWLTRSPSEYVADHVRLVVDGACERGEGVGARMTRMLPAGVLLYGSDAPFASSAALAALAELPDDLRPAAARANALATFGHRLLGDARPAP